jgi:uncharacterized RDD family membrane protein YckC
MVNDTVREELASRISPISQSLENRRPEPEQAVLELPPISNAKPNTSELVSKRTNPTLIGFQSENAVLPDWRLRIQNSVRMRVDKERGGIGSAGLDDDSHSVVGEGAVEAQNSPPLNSKLASAMRRIEESRTRFSSTRAPRAQNVATISTPRTTQFTAPKPAPENYRRETRIATAVSPAPIVEKPAPAIETPTPVIEKKIGTSFSAKPARKFSTNKLLPLPEGIASSFSSETEESSVTGFRVTITGNERKVETEEPVEMLTFAATESDTVIAPNQAAREFDAIDDCAPFALRFNAGLFDFIIGSFISIVLLVPFTFAGGTLFSFPGFVAFLATDAIVMFIYLTISIGLTGRTPGMRMFSLEIVDIEENAYPSFHQAAVSSSVYLLSLATLGLGFITMFLNVEKRAAHDLLSGTIVVREY